MVVIGRVVGSLGDLIVRLDGLVPFVPERLVDEGRVCVNTHWLVRNGYVSTLIR